MIRRIVLASAMAGAIVCALASAADAHVTIDPPSAPQGGSAKLSFLVPNEDARATVTKIQIAFPTPPAAPISNVSVGQKSGWKSTVTMKHLAKAITTDDGTVTDIVSEIDWVALTPAEAVKPGEFGEFTIDADGLPAHEDHMVFKAIQTYSNGKVVRWIDPVTEESPAGAFPTPILELTVPGGSTGTPTTSSVSTGGAGTILSTSTKDNSARALGVIGIALGAVALVSATGALVRKRRAA
jgi:periplasmic copper chaperone A